MAPALLVWDCAQTFHKQLRLACYGIDDFVNALSSEAVDSVLMIETVRSMLRIILAEGAISIEDEAAKASDDEDEEEEEEQLDDSLRETARRWLNPADEDEGDGKTVCTVASQH